MMTPAACSAFALLMTTLGAAPAVPTATALPQNVGYGGGGQAQGGQGSGYGYSQPSQSAGYGNSQGGNSQGGGFQGDGSVNGVPRGVGYNQQGGEMSRMAAEQAALAPEYHMHVVGTNAASAVGSGAALSIQHLASMRIASVKSTSPTRVHVGLAQGATRRGGRVVERLRMESRRPHRPTSGTVHASGRLGSPP